MRTSPSRRVKTKPPTLSTIEVFNDALLALLAQYPPGTRYVGWAFVPCRRCRASSYAVRTTATDELLLLFCTECWWSCMDSSSPAWRRAMANFDPRAADLPHNPDKPLERSIKKHLRSIRSGSD